ncbi:hypothetical protein [Arthrobacter sp. SLBN-112]|uniref:hypothetical protein n=1 Tax=Arthrobacter sp. SLBN-112 TaxID=2768452 RepID=UPI0027AEE8CA|nr:hypothetical protein [Arthrobacter sp. SLBN-112]MDQ0798986.1 hypothetical protein [Arthrobacter sp. SLBN-112]
MSATQAEYSEWSGWAGSAKASTVSSYPGKSAGVFQWAAPGAVDQPRGRAVFDWGRRETSSSR